jgi:hypothetical protein
MDVTLQGGTQAVEPAPVKVCSVKAPKVDAAQVSPPPEAQPGGTTQAPARQQPAAHWLAPKRSGDSSATSAQAPALQPWQVAEQPMSSTHPVSGTHAELVAPTQLLQVGHAPLPVATKAQAPLPSQPPVPQPVAPHCPKRSSEDAWSTHLPPLHFLQRASQRFVPSRSRVPSGTATGSSDAPSHLVHAGCPLSPGGSAPHA